MSSTSWNDDEEAALMYLSHRAQVLYLRGLRRFMDYSTGIVGDRRHVSLQQMRECLEVNPDKESRQPRYQPTFHEIRASLAQLERHGLIQRLQKGSKRDPMRFLLPMASIRAHEEPQKKPQEEPQEEPQIYGPINPSMSGACGNTAAGRTAGRTAWKNRIPPVIPKTPVYHAREAVVDKSVVIADRSGWGDVLAGMGFRQEQIFSAKNLAMFGVWVDQRLTLDEFEQAAAVAHAKNNGLPANVAFYGWAVTDVIRQRGRKVCSGGGYGQGGGYRESGASVLARGCAGAFDEDTGDD